MSGVDELRAAVVPVAAARDEGLDVRVMRFGASANVSYAMFSGGGMSMVEAYQDGILSFWLASAAGVVLGALLGLFASLGCQNLRQKRANQALVPTPASVTPAAGAPVAPDTGAAHL